MESFDQKATSEFLYRLLRHLSGEERDDIAGIKASAIKAIAEKDLGISKIQNLLLADNGNSPQLEELLSDGVTSIGTLVSENQAKEIRSYFSDLKGYPTHLASENTINLVETGCKDALRESGAYWCSYSPLDSIRAPHILDVLRNPKVIDIVSKYLGCVPTLYNLNVWWTFANTKKRAPIAQMFHRDPDDFRFVTVFLYLTDVEKGNGSHEVLKSTHNHEKTLSLITQLRNQKNLSDDFVQSFLTMSLNEDGNKLELDRMIESVFGEYIQDLHGTAGTAFLEDTWALHRAVPYSKVDRLVLWARFGLGVNSETALNGSFQAALYPDQFSSNLEKIIFRNFILPDTRTMIVVCTQSTKECAQKFILRHEGETILYELEDTFSPERSDYQGLIKLINSHSTGIVCTLFLFDEFNPARDFLFSQCAALDIANLTHPETMPIPYTLQETQFEYSRRILPYPAPKINKEVAERILGEISDIFIASELYWHISFGTLLGLTRDEGIFPWDTDLDLITLEEELPNFVKLFPTLIESGFEVARLNPNMITFWKHGVGIDLYHLTYRRKLLGGSYFVGKKLYFKEIPKVQKQEFQHIGWTLLPENQHEILENLYGPNWRIPDPKWEWGSDLF